MTIRLGLITTTILTLVAASNYDLRAQGTNVLDTAPGVKTDSAVPSPTVAATPTPPAEPTVPAGTSLLSNGDFSQSKDQAWPDDWPKAGDGVSWKTEGARHYLGFVSQKPEQQVELERAITIPAGAKALEFSAKYRVSGLQKGRDAGYDDARVILIFTGTSGKPLAAAPPMVFPAPAAKWTDINERFVVPKGAAGLLVTPCLFHVRAGALDLAEVRVTTIGDAEAATLQTEADAAAAKKAADQAAIIEREVAMPSKCAELKVSGNKLVTPDGKAVWLQGVNVCGLEWLPKGDNPLWSIHVAIDDWKANVIRLPVMNSFWFGRGKGKIPPNDANLYRETVDKAIRIAAGKGAYIVLDLHRYLTPDEGCVEFWKDAAARYKNNPAVLFDILNEPNGTTWEIWRNGGQVDIKGKNPQTIQSVGMQGLVDAVRGTGAKNVIVAGGLGYAYDLTGILKGYALDDKGGNGIMYATHFYNWHKHWEDHFMAVAEKYPVLVGECGADTHKMNFIPVKAQEDPYTWAPDAIGFIQKHHLNWTAWSFHTKATPDLLLDWEYYTPTPFWGAFVKDALAGKQYEMKRTR